MSKYQNLIDKRDEGEIDLIELIGMVFNHFIMCVLIVLAFTLAGVAFAYLKPEKRAVSATVEVKAPEKKGDDTVSTLSKYGVETYNAASVMSMMLSNDIINASIPSGSDGSSLVDSSSMKYTAVTGTNYYKITIENAEDTDFYVALLNNMIENTRAKVAETYTLSAEKGLSLCSDALNKFVQEAPSSSSDYSSVLNSYLSDKITIQNYIDLASSSVTIFEAPSASTVTGTSKTMICIVAFLIGGVVAVITAIAIDFVDKRIYSSERVMEFVGDKLVASIPLYKDATKINANEFSYIASKLPSDYSSIVVTSLSDKAGKTTISNGLVAQTKTKVVDAATLIEKPEVLSLGGEKDLLIVVLRAGKDNFVELDKLITDLKGQNKNYLFVLNAVDISDKNTNKYSDKDSYYKHIWLKDSWRGFYKAHY